MVEKNLKKLKAKGPYNYAYIRASLHVSGCGPVLSTF